MSDEEIEKINRRKFEELLQRKTAQKDSPKAEKNDKPLTLTDANFSEAVSKQPLMVVDFWAPWCGPCRMVAPVIEQLATEYAGKVAFGKLNVDENPMISNAFQIRSIPTLLVFKNGKPVDGLLGAAPKTYIESKFKPYLSGSPSPAYQ